MNTKERRFVPRTVKFAALLCVVMLGLNVSAYFIYGYRSSRSPDLVLRLMVGMFSQCGLWGLMTYGIWTLDRMVWKFAVFIWFLVLAGQFVSFYMRGQGTLAPSLYPASVHVLIALGSMLALLLLVLPSSLKAFDIDFFTEA